MHKVQEPCGHELQTRVHAGVADFPTPLIPLTQTV